MKFTVYEEKVVGPVMEFEGASVNDAKNKVLEKYPDDTKTRFLLAYATDNKMGGFNIYPVRNAH